MNPMQAFFFSIEFIIVICLQMVLLDMSSAYLDPCKRRIQVHGSILPTGCFGFLLAEMHCS